MNPNNPLWTYLYLKWEDKKMFPCLSSVNYDKLKDKSIGFVYDEIFHLLRLKKHSTIEKSNSD